MRYLLILLLLTGCATEKGNKRQAQHAQDQVRMVAVQREAMVQEAQAESETQQALVEALARVAEANPQEASSVAVALAVMGVKSADSEKADAPVIALQRQENIGLEYTKALAPTVGGLITGVGIAAINAETQRNASDNNRKILLGDQAADLGIVQAVAGLGTAAASQTGIEVAGSYYDLQDSASVDNSTDSSDNSTVTNTTSSDSSDSSTTTTSADTTTSFSLDTTLSYSGQAMTLAALIEQLKGAGATYSIDLDGDGTPDASGGDGTTPTVAIVCEGPMFSPKPPSCT